MSDPLASSSDAQIVVSPQLDALVRAAFGEGCPKPFWLRSTEMMAEALRQRIAGASEDILGRNGGLANGTPSEAEDNENRGGIPAGVLRSKGDALASAIVKFCTDVPPCVECAASTQMRHHRSGRLRSELARPGGKLDDATRSAKEAELEAILNEPRSDKIKARQAVAVALAAAIDAISEDQVKQHVSLAMAFVLAITLGYGEVKDVDTASNKSRFSAFFPATGQFEVKCFTAAFDTLVESCWACSGSGAPGSDEAAESIDVGADVQGEDRIPMTALHIAIFCAVNPCGQCVGAEGHEVIGAMLSTLGKVEPSLTSLSDAVLWGNVVAHLCHIIKVTVDLGRRMVPLHDSGLLEAAPRFVERFTNQAEGMPMLSALLLWSVCDIARPPQKTITVTPSDRVKLVEVQQHAAKLLLRFTELRNDQMVDKPVDEKYGRSLKDFLGPMHTLAAGALCGLDPKGFNESAEIEVGYKQFSAAVMDIVYRDEPQQWKWSTSPKTMVDEWLGADFAVLELRYVGQCFEAVMEWEPSISTKFANDSRFMNQVLFTWFQRAACRCGGRLNSGWNAFARHLLLVGSQCGATLPILHKRLAALTDSSRMATTQTELCASMGLCTRLLRTDPSFRDSLAAKTDVLDAVFSLFPRINAKDGRTIAGALNLLSHFHQVSDSLSKATIGRDEIQSIFLIHPVIPDAMKDPASRSKIALEYLGAVVRSWRPASWGFRPVCHFGVNKHHWVVRKLQMTFFNATAPNSGSEQKPLGHSSVIKLPVDFSAMQTICPQHMPCNGKHAGVVDKAWLKHVSHGAVARNLIIAAKLAKTATDANAVALFVIGLLNVVLLEKDDIPDDEPTMAEEAERFVITQFEYQREVLAPHAALFATHEVQSAVASLWNNNIPGNDKKWESDLRFALALIDWHRFVHLGGDVTQPLVA